MLPQDILLWNFAPIIFQPITAPDSLGGKNTDNRLVTKNDLQNIPEQRAIWSGTGQFGQNFSVADFPFFDILNRLHRQFWR